MEVGDKCVNCLKLIAGVDENSRFGIHRMHKSVGCGCTLKHAAGGRSYGNNASTALTSAVNLICNLARDVEILAVHLVLLYLIHLYRTEGAKSNVEGDLTVANALCLNSLKQLVCEMKSCGGSSGRALLLGIHGLVIILVFKLLGDIGGKRHIAYCIKHLVDILIFFGVILEFYGTVTALNDRGDGGVKNVREIKTCTHLGSLAGTYKGFPLTVFKHTEKEKLDVSACLIGLAKESGRDNLGGVYNKHILGVKVIYDFAENLMLHLTALAIKGHKSTAVALVAG